MGSLHDHGQHQRGSLHIVILDSSSNFIVVFHDAGPHIVLVVFHHTRLLMT